MKKILFLDIDGVMVPYGKNVSTDGLYDHTPFDRDCTKILNAVIDKTDCEIIISSTWKHFFDLRQIQEIFTWNGVKKTPSGFTPNYNENLAANEEPDTIKCKEILEWLSKFNPEGRFNWCAADDWDLSFALQNFVGCSDNTQGLKFKGVYEKIISYLKTT